MYQSYTMNIVYYEALHGLLVRKDNKAPPCNTQSYPASYYLASEYENLSTTEVRILQKGTEKSNKATTYAKGQVKLPRQTTDTVL
jgi:hypothetical protein